MAVKVTITFKDGTERIIEARPLGIDRCIRLTNAMGYALIQLTDEEWNKVEHYKLEDEWK